MGHSFAFEIVPVSEVPGSELQDNRNIREVCEHRLDVLVVDDEPLIALSLAAILKTSGLEVASATGGQVAFELAMARRPRMLLTDVAMPGMDGIDLAIAVTSAQPECRVLLFSGHAATVDLLRSRAAGYSFPLLAKPMHPVEMLRRVGECLGEEQAIPEKRKARAQVSDSGFSRSFQMLMA